MKQGLLQAFQQQLGVTRVTHFTYNAKIHRTFTNEEGLLVSYDVNCLAPVTDPLSPLVTAASYRPRFIRVKLHWGK